MAAYDGGGILGAAGHFTIDRCVISNNVAGYNSVGYGGGLYFQNGGGLVTNCVISSNLATDDIEEGGCIGGGMLITGDYAIIDCAITDNEASWGDVGGLLLYRGRAIRCAILGNHASPYSGGATAGLVLAQGATAHECLIAGNYVQWGPGCGGVDVDRGALENCTIAHNRLMYS